MVNEYLYNKLINKYNGKHHQLIVAVDFDDTIVPSTYNNIEQCLRTIKLLKQCNELELNIIIYTARMTNIKNIEFISAQMDELEIKFDKINENVIRWNPQPSKLYYDILLDDKAGLTECQDTLEAVIKYIYENNSLYKS